MKKQKSALSDSAISQLVKGVPADKVLAPHVQLSPRERIFVDRMLEGATKREALADSYGLHGTDRTISTQAWKVATRPEVQQALSQQQALHRLRYSQDPVQIRNWLVDTLQHEARTAQRTGDRLRAMELIGRLADVAAFESRSVVEHRRSDVRQTLEAKLRGMALEIEAVDSTKGGRGMGGTTGGDKLGPCAEADPSPNNPLKSSQDFLNKSQDFLDKSQDLDKSEDSLDTSENFCDDLEEKGDLQDKELSEEPPGDVLDTSPIEEKFVENLREMWKDPKRWYAYHAGPLPESMDREEFRRRFWDDTATE